MATTDAQDGKAVVVNGGKRLDLGVGLCNLHRPADSAELLIYNRGLTEAETSALDAYLACTYFR